MSELPAAAAPESGIDPEIAELLQFEPVPRKTKRPDGWNADRQREFIALLARLGSPRLACEAMDKNLSGAALLYKLAEPRNSAPPGTSAGAEGGMGASGCGAGGVGS